MLAYFDPQPARAALPARFPSPFAGAPHPIARRAAEELAGAIRGLAGSGELDAPGGGKMFGVLVARDGAGRIGYLRAFSGMLGGRWLAPGFAPPAFDTGARDAFWPAGEAELDALAARIAALDDEAAPLRRALAALDARHADADTALRARHAERRAERHAARARRAGGDVHELDQQSRADGAERRAMRAAHAGERAPTAARIAALEDERRILDGERAARSRGLLERLQDTYVLANARGERRSLRELFAPGEPPGGAGDCAAPKLLAYAYRAGLSPIALAEVWWGAPPLTGGRHAGRFYPACRGKCGPILAHMLGGLPAEPPPVFGASPAGAATRELRVVFEDDWLVVVDKPAGLLTVPGRGSGLADCLLSRLRARLPGALVAHRLDLDTSGLVLAAKDRRTHAALQQQFARREIDKCYDAVLDGVPRGGDGGVIELALRVDLDDRPRQIHDPVHGKPAITEWRVVERLPGGRTRVELVPRTGRTHQLRVHAAHPLGLDAPIVGDRLYGRGPRPDADDDAALLLRAVSLAFVHPARGTRLHLDAPRQIAVVPAATR